MKDKKILSMLMSSIMIFVLLGGTLAYVVWGSNDANRTNVVFDIKDGYSCAADGGGDITSNDAFIAPASCTNEKYAIKREVTVSPTVIEKGLTIGMDLWLDINDIGAGLSGSENFRYALTTSSISCDGSDGEVIVSGNFNGKNIGDKIVLLEQKHYKATKNDKYYLYVWLDAEEKSTATQNQTFSLSLGGSCNKLYSITYDLKGGDGTVTTQYKGNNETIVISNEIPTKAGYNFLGWSTSSAAVTVQYQSGDDLSVNENVTLYAVWNILAPTESYSCANGSVGAEPYLLTYTGNCTMTDDGNGLWRMKFLSNGEFISKIDLTIDAFLVGGGGGGGSGGFYGSGGGGGYTITQKEISLIADKSYEIVIGSGGGSGGAGSATTAFEVTVNGGAGARKYAGGSGGSGGGARGDNENSIGGNGGSNGSSGTKGSSVHTSAGSGQGTTTREFGESTGDLYAGGGGGAGYTGGAGGSGGGGNGTYSGTGGGGAKNTGGGGGGSETGVGGSGGSGIVVIRNVKTGTKCSGDSIANSYIDYMYTGDCEIIDESDGNWKIKFLSDGEFITNSDVTIDAFLVGGGGGGGSGGFYASGGGGGYTITQKEISLIADKSYEIVIGSGGGPTGSGGSTTAFEATANGGAGARQYAGGSGGSGGGARGDNENSIGGNGGSNGSSGTKGSSVHTSAGSGQGTTTREFGESTGDLYAGGGGGAGYTGGAGGSGGGGNGTYSGTGGGGAKNTGGGGSETGVGGYGGSGIVVIRNKR